MVGITDRFDPPLSNEIEVTLIGAASGMGESVVIHLGNNEWMVVDSCIDSITKNSLPLQYLEEIGIDVSTCLKHVVCTHWHEDHIQGLHMVLNKCGNDAVFYVPTATDRKQFFYYVSREKYDIKKEGSSVFKELMNCLDVACNKGIKLKQVLQDTMLFRRNSNIPTKCSALSPSQGANLMFQQELANATYAYKKTAEQQKAIIEYSGIEDAKIMQEEILQELEDAVNEPIEEAPDNEKIDLSYYDNFRDAKQVKLNTRCMAMVLSVNNHHIVLGADLEKDKDNGWESVLNECSCITDIRAGMFKIPHHGSDTGHYEAFITNHVKSNATSKLTTWTKGGLFLPKKEIVQKYYNHSQNLYISTLQLGKKQLLVDKSTKKQMTESVDSITLLNTTPGIIRSRILYDSDSDDWTTQCFGSAKKLNQELIKSFAE